MDAVISDPPPTPCQISDPYPALVDVKPAVYVVLPTTRVPPEDARLIGVPLMVTAEAPGVMVIPEITTALEVPEGEGGGVMVAATLGGWLAVLEDPELDDSGLVAPGLGDPELVGPAFGDPEGEFTCAPAVGDAAGGGLVSGLLTPGTET